MSKPLSPEDRDRLEDLFERACELPTAEHASFVSDHCSSNEPLRSELLRLLAAAQKTNLLDQLQPSGLRPAEPLRPGTRIGAYRLLERVGEGGMGEVYAADQLAPVVRKVALKLIKLGMDSHQVVARFEAERQALARMSHPHIAQVYDGGITEDARPFFVMEFVSGLAITDFCDRHRLSTEERLSLFLEVCDGVQHAHLKGIIHRDLKPSNLLVMKQDGRAGAKIIDFGVARATTGRLAEQTLHTMVGQIVGTLDYMSPEQADPTGVDIDTRSDIYSLGVVLYQLLSGLLPFDLSSAADVPLSELQRRIREQDPQTPSTRLRSRIGTTTGVAPQHGTDERSLIRQLAGDLDWICLKALEKDPARRYQSAADLAADVRRHLANQPVSAGRPGALYRMRKFARRHRTAVSAGVLIAAFAFVGIYGLVTGNLEARAQQKIAASYSDYLMLAGLEKEADALWPPHPDKLDDMELWMSEVRTMVENLSVHRANLVRVRAQRDSQPTSAATRRLVTKLSQLITRLENLERRLQSGNALGGADYWGVERRLAEARRLEAGFAPGGEYDRVWQDNLPEICAAYAGHPEIEKLDVQMGLLPIGKDPDSSFWLFAHLLSGEPATLVDGKVVMKEETGFVMTLLPGGTYMMGSEFTDEPGPNHVASKYRRIREGPIQSVQLEPFFLSKFEMTQAQWQRFVGRNPSHEQASFPQVELQPHNPVNQVDWHECNTTAYRLGLMLPHEEQWEYAARGGTSSTWWTGDDPADLVTAENLVGDADAFLTITAVGSMRPNPFGLYDMLGNVSEWCHNHPYSYGQLEPDETKNDHAGRGGSSRVKPTMARSGARMSGPAALVDPAHGLRPARPVEMPTGR